MEATSPLAGSFAGAHKIAFLKVLPALKVPLLGLIGFVVADLSGLPVHDIWFDYVLFIVFSAAVSGMPEPDTDLPLGKFCYTWLYRSGHLLVASATAYFLHQKKWNAISDGKEEEK